jgi:hypothetical protein
VTFSREELDWIEAEWAYHLHGRQAFLSREDYLQVKAWESEGAPAELLVNAMEAFFQRRAKRARPRAFTALSHLAKDVVKGMGLREALRKGGAPLQAPAGWEQVKEPLRANPKARAAFEAWALLRSAPPSPESPGFLEHFDREQAAFKELVVVAEGALGAESEALKTRLEARLDEAKLEAGSPLRERAWRHHWGRMVCEAWGISC